MPAYQTMLGELNRLLSPPMNAELDPELFAPGRRFTEAAEVLGVTKMRGVDGYIEVIPDAIIQSLRAAIYSALTREPRMAVTVAWAPGYDFEVSVWEAPGTDETPGGITVLLRSRYPSDPHPLRGPAAV